MHHFHGLFLGIDRYASPLINELSCAARDARALHALFADNLGADRAVLLCDQNATRTSILDQFEHLATVGSDDTVVVTFAGHGSDDHYLMTHDADPAALDATAIGLDQLVELFRRIPARNAFLILDCCFSGGAGARVFRHVLATRGFRSAGNVFQVAGQGRIILTASDPMQEAIEDPVRRHGLLTFHLLEALRGAPEVVADGRISLYRLLEHVTRRVQDVAAGFHHIQHPTLRGTVDGEVTLPVMRPGRLYMAAFPEHSRAPVSPALEDLEGRGIPHDAIDVWRRAISGLNELQMQTINDYGLLDGESLVVSAPTSSGKTLLGELAAIRSFSERTRSLFLLPIRALVNDKFAEFCERYGPLGMRVIRATGEHRDNLPELLHGRYDLCLMTYETATAQLLLHPHILRQVGLVVVDEVQMLADANRGANLELLLTLLRTRRGEGLCPQIVALSAVIGSTNGLERWLSARLIRSDRRPVPLCEGIVRADGSFRHLDEHGVEHVIPFIAREPRKDTNQDYVIPLVRRLISDGEKVIVFRETKSETRSVARYLARELSLPTAQDVIDDLPSTDPSAASDGLRECLVGGVAFHNADLDRDERQAIERAFRDRTSPLRVLVATTTLAMGVNTPASSVIIVGLTHPKNQRYTVAEYKNMVGRAGRLGFAERGKSFLLATSVGEERLYWDAYVRGRPEELNSRLLDADPHTLVTRVLATAQSTRAVGLTETEVVAFLESSFGAFQRTQCGSAASNRAAIRAAIGMLLEHGLVAREDERIRLTDLGRVAGESGVAVESVLRLAAAFRGATPGTLTDAAVLGAVQATVELDDTLIPLHPTSQKERARWQGVLQDQGLPTNVVAVLRRTAKDDAAITTRAKRLAAVLLWIQGRDLRSLEESLLLHCRGDDAAGAVRGIAERSRDIVPAAARVAALIGGDDVAFARRVESLLIRLEFGVPRELVPLARHAGALLLRGDYLALGRSGLASFEAIAVATDEALTHVLGSEMKGRVVRDAHAASLAAKTIDEARKRAENVLPVVEPLDDPP